MSIDILIHTAVRPLRHLDQTYRQSQALQGNVIDIFTTRGARLTHAQLDREILPVNRECRLDRFRLTDPHRQRQELRLIRHVSPLSAIDPVAWLLTAPVDRSRLPVAPSPSDDIATAVNCAVPV